MANQQTTSHRMIKVPKSSRIEGKVLKSEISQSQRAIHFYEKMADDDEEGVVLIANDQLSRCKKRRSTPTKWKNKKIKMAKAKGKLWLC